MDVVGDVVAAHRNAAGRLDRPVLIEHVVGGAAADVDHQRAALLRLAVERDLGGRDRREDQIVDVERHLAHALDLVFNPRPDPVNDMKVGIDRLSGQPDRRGRVFEAVHPEAADDMMKIDVIGRDGHRPGDLLRLLHVGRGDHRLVVGQAEAAAVVHALDVRAGDGEVDAADLDIAGVLRLDQRILHAGADLGEIVDLPLANTNRLRLADAEDFDGAVRLHFADHHANLAGADFESDVDLGTWHGVLQR